VEGNDKTRDNVILRELRITDGDMFEGKKLRRSAERLNKLQYFDSVSTELVPTEHEDEVDLKVKVKEKNTGALIGGVGYSTYYEFGVSGTIMERNLFGKGYQTSLMALFSGRRTAYQWSFTNPRYNDTNLSVGYDAYNIRDEFTDFSKNTIGNTIRFAYPIGEYTTVGWGYRLDFYKLYDIEDDAAKIIRDREGDNVSSVVHGRVTRDTTDSRDNPTRGNITKIFTEYGGGLLMGDDNFFKPTAQTEQYYQIRPNHVLHGRMRGGVVLETKDGEEVPVFERFYIGGIDSIRGYSSKDISPRDPDTGDRIGGDRMAFANMEYIWVFHSELGLALVPFFDIGFNSDSRAEFNWDDEIKKSVGLELRWRSP
ncbi:MAG: outer membrane protein assembly factor BamA, partial [Sphingomonas hengshuiensis]